MDQQAQSDAALIDAASAINDLTNYVARNVLGKGRPSAALESQLMAQVHQRLHAVGFTMIQLHRDKHAVERLAKSDRDVLGMTDYVRRIGPDIEVATLAHEAKQLRDVLAEILLSTKTRNWFWKALDEQFAIPVTTMSGLKHPKHGARYSRNLSSALGTDLVASLHQNLTRCKFQMIREPLSGLPPHDGFLLFVQEIEPSKAERTNNRQCPHCGALLKLHE